MRGISRFLAATAALLLATGVALAAALGDVAGNAGNHGGALTAEQIVEKNAVARGGIEAWRKVEALAWAGHIERASAPMQRIEFVLEQKRPNKTRFEANFNNQVSTRIFDGSKGWKSRPARDGRPDVKPYSAEELEFAQDGQVIDGPLLDYAAKGHVVTLEGSEMVEGRRAWRLRVRLPSGYSQQVWIDAETFLDLKYERRSGIARGPAATATVYYRDYRTVEGLTMPMVIETGDPANGAADKMVIEKVAINPALPEKMFDKPRDAGKPRRGVIVDTTAQAMPRNLAPAR
jgi:hypothetical protein